MRSPRSEMRSHRPSTDGRGRWGRLCKWAATAALGLGLLSAPTAAEGAAPPLRNHFCDQGVTAGKCRIPRGIAVDQASGAIYVADQDNFRINKFTAWGEFSRAWGWDVVGSGPGDDGSGFEICVPARGDDCKAGAEGVAAGQFGTLAAGVAVDPQTGDVYVTDRLVGSSGERVQKFDSEGNFLLMFGGGVNQGPNHPGDVCTAQHLVEGDVCGQGTVGDPGPGEGQFGRWPVASFVAVGPDRTVYVGDQERIQAFLPDGSFKSQLSLAGKGFVSGLAIAPGGGFYASFASSSSGLEPKPNVLRLDGAGNTVCTIPAINPVAVASDGGGNAYVFGGIFEGQYFLEGGTLQRFTPDCAIDAQFSFKPGVDFSTGLAVTEACGIEGQGFFISNSKNGDSFVNLFGPAPEAELCAPPVAAPSIDDQFVTAGDSGEATLRARINPHFWPDTRYYVEYGTAPCSLGGCDRQQPAAPGSLLTRDAVDGAVTTGSVFLGGLAPGTTYHFRFVAESGGGGPVRGVGGTEAEDGVEGSFRTAAIGSDTDDGCANQALRYGASAKLPDCRAYELVTPLEKNNGDVALNPEASESRANFVQAAEDGSRMTFTSSTAFADPEGGWLSNQYLAERLPGAGWGTRAISPPRDSRSFYPNVGSALFPFKAFSPSLCSGWVVTANEGSLGSGAPPGVPNLYRRDLCGPAGDELLTSTPPPGFGGEVESILFPEPQGASEDELHTAFRVDAALAVTPGDPVVPLRCAAAGGSEAVAFQWLRNGAAIPGATADTYVPGAEDAGAALQCQVTASSAEGTSAQASKPQVLAPAPQLPPPAVSRNGLATNRIPYQMERGVAIAGTPAVGETLTCNPTAWLGSPNFSYAWLRAGAPIAGATGATYAPVGADRGAAVQCQLTATNAGGAVLAVSPLVVITGSPPATTVPPSISGTPAVGETLTCDPGAWQNGPAFSYVWLRDGDQIAGAAASTRTVVAGDAGKTIQCRVRGANTSGAAVAPSAAVVIPPSPATAPPAQTGPGAISGTPHVGGVLGCAPGEWSGAPSLSYRWLRNGVGISGATESEYELTADDRAKAIQCQVSGENSGGTVVAITPASYVDPDPPPAPGSWAYSVYQVYMTTPGQPLHLVSVRPDGSPALGHSSVGTAQGGEGETIRGNVDSAVSADASRVFWTENGKSGPPSSSEGRGDQTGDLYLRLNATADQSAVSGGECTEPEKACTIPVSVEAGRSARFLAADRDGTWVLYATGIDGPSIDKFGDKLYEATIEGTAGQPQATPRLIAEGIIGVMGASEDASRVYFASGEALPEAGSNPEGQVPQAGKPNLYLGAPGGELAFVGTLGPQDVLALGLDNSPWLSPVSVSNSMRTSRVSPDGRYAAFTSTAPLTGYDNADLGSGEPASEVFRYDAQQGELICVSCNPSGARPVAAKLRSATGTPEITGLWSAAQLPGWPSESHASHVLADNGQRVFFNAFDALVPGDTNGRQDVYEWEAPGEGSCTEAKSAFSPANGGCLYLITSGQSPSDSEIFDVTPTGSDVFFATQSSLLPQDYGLRDVYDARVEGGFAQPPAPLAACEGEACQGTPEPPIDATPASSAFAGAGNVVEAKPRKHKHKKRHKAKKKRHKAKKKPQHNKTRSAR